MLKAGQEFSELQDSYMVFIEKYAKDYAEEYAKQKAETVRLNSLLESIRKLMANMKLGAEQAMNVLEVNEHDREILLKKL